MKTQSLGGSTLESTTLAYGCMRIAGTWEPSKITDLMRESGRNAVIAAFEAGYRLFDHADIYCRGECEAIHGEVLRDVPSMRDETAIATKCGIRFAGDPNSDSPHRFDFSAEHIIQSCEASLKRLGVECIDLYQLHRPDALMNPTEVARAFESLASAGKVLHFGVSNFYPSQFKALQAHCDMPLIVNQVEIHLLRLDCFTDGTLDLCLEADVTPLSWSPLAGGLLGDHTRLAPEHPRYELIRNLQTQTRELAERHQTSEANISLAWLLQHPSQIVPIVGSTDPTKIRDAVRSTEIELGREDWYRLYVAARGEPLP